MIVRYPGVIQPTVNNTDVWYFADVLPTLATIANAPIPEHIDGINTWAAIIGEQPLISERYLYWEFYEGRFGQAIRWKNWKGVKNDVNDSWELYDLATDESEENDLAKDNPEMIQQFISWINENREESPYWKSGL